MKVSKLKNERRFRVDLYDKSKRIKLYGEENSYPQDLLNIISASRTASGCIAKFRKFIGGAGFANSALNNIIVNSEDDGTDLYELHKQITDDFSKFNGFAIVVGYDGRLNEHSYKWIPFEHCRLEIDEEKNFTGRIAVHPDWTRQLGKTFKNTDIEYFDPYTPDKAKVREIVKKEGFGSFKGLVFYYSPGVYEYPASPVDPIRELMAAEAAADNIRVRNVKNNFLPAGVLYRTVEEETINSDDDSEEEKEGAQLSFDEFADSVDKWQGDENALKIIVMEAGPGETIKFESFAIQNLDKLTELTDKTNFEGIRSFLGVPPELLSATGGRGFAAETLKDAYDFYNSFVEEDRQTLERAYRKVFKNLLLANNQPLDLSIKPISYISSTVTSNTTA